MKRPTTYFMQSPPGPETVINGDRYIYFGGTSYLGLHAHPEVIDAACDAMQKLGLHSASSRTRVGNVQPVVDVERLAAKYFGSEDAFYFVSGYLSIWVILHALQDEFDTFIVDSGCHYSITDAVRCFGKPMFDFSSRDASSLEQKLSSLPASSRNPLLISDGVFSADGSLAPVEKYVDVLARWGGGGILLDDAHGFGVVGASGRGTFEQAGMWTSINSESALGENIVRLYACGTLSKALGGFGGIVTGSIAFIHKLKSSTRLFNAASAPPTPVAAASAKSLEILLREPDRLERLRLNIHRIKSGLSQMGLDVIESPSAIVGLVTGDDSNMQNIHERLKQSGIFVPYAASYSGGGGGFLRISVFSTHTSEMIDELLSAVALLV